MLGGMENGNDKEEWKRDCLSRFGFEYKILLPIFAKKSHRIFKFSNSANFDFTCLIRSSWLPCGDVRYFVITSRSLSLSLSLTHTRTLSLSHENAHDFSLHHSNSFISFLSLNYLFLSLLSARSLNRRQTGILRHLRRRWRTVPSLRAVRMSITRASWLERKM